MTVLADLLAGAGDPALQTCRLEGFGGTLYGREAIGDCLSALHPRLKPPSLDIETDRMAIWLDADHAVCADVVGGRVERLWIMSDQKNLEPMPGTDVPIDPDLIQASRGPRFEPRDHPDLSTADAERLSRALAEWRIEGLARLRPIVIRAASMGAFAVALVRIEAERPGPLRWPLGFNGLLIVGPGPTLHRLDQAGWASAASRTWTPRV